MEANRDTTTLYNNWHEFWFVRHGRTPWSTEDITLGPIDCSLNDLGKQDASSAADILASRIEDYVLISSFLKRAEKTAKIISKKIKVPVNLFSDLHERFYGDYSQLSEQEILEGGVPLDAESDRDFQMRVSATFSSLISSEAFYGKKKVIVSHSRVFKQLSLNLTGKEISIGYGEVYHFTPPQEPEGKWTAKHCIT